MRPIISYYGGKQRMTSKILPLIPLHSVYVEPFCGGASLLFSKSWPRISNTDQYREYINDHDERLINFYRTLRDPTKRGRLIEMIQLTLHSEAEYRDSKIKIKDGSDDVERAWAYYVNIQQSFNNVLNSGWRRSVSGCNFAANWASKISNLSEYLNRMSAVCVSCQDALKVIKQLDSPQTFFYCDPPYPGACQGHYSGYSVENFERLVEVLDGCQGAFMLSCYEVPGVRIPGDWKKYEFDAACTAGSRSGRGGGGRVEVVYRRLAKSLCKEKIKTMTEEPWMPKAWRRKIKFRRSSSNRLARLAEG